MAEDVCRLNNSEGIHLSIRWKQNQMLCATKGILKIYINCFADNTSDIERSY